MRNGEAVMKWKVKRLMGLSAAVMLVGGLGGLVRAESWLERLYGQPKAL